MFKLLGIKSEFSKNVATLFSGTLIGQALPILISPLLSRIYSPEDFGQFGLFMAIIGILSVLATARFEYAVVLPEKDKDATSLISISLIFTFSVFIISFLSIFLFKEKIIDLFSSENKKIGSWIYIIPFSLLILGVSQTLNYWSSRNKTFKLNALSRVFQSTGNVGSTTCFGYLNTGSFGLILGYFIGQVLGLTVLVKSSFKQITAINKGVWIDKAEIKSNFKKYKDFAFINTPHALVGSFQENGVIFFITYFFSSGVLGCYSFAIRILNAPIGIIGAAFYQVFYQQASKMYNEGQELSTLVIKMYKRLFILGAPFFLILFLISPQLFTFVFGDKWLEAGQIAQILVPWLFLNFLVTPVSCLPLIVNKQKQGFLIQLIDIIFKYGAIILGGFLGNYKLAFMIFSIWGCLLMLFAIWWYYKLSLITKEKLNELD